MNDLLGFGVDQDAGLDTFGTEPVSKPIKAELSDKVVAAQGAILNKAEGQLIETFNRLSGLSPEERQAELDSITSAVYRDNVRQSQNLAASMLLDPDMTEENAESIMQSIAGISQQKPNSMDLMAEELGVKPNADEDYVSEDIRIDTVEISREINQSLRERQAIVNGDLLSTNKGAMNALGDLVELIVPLSEGLMTEEVVRKIRGGSVAGSAEAIALMGNAKMDLKAIYQNLDHQGQKLFQQYLAEIVNNSEGIVFTNDNDLYQKDLFNSIVEDQYYGTGTQVLDNIISILDLVGLGAAVRLPKMLLTSGKAASRRVRAGVQPASPAKVAAEVNPEEARKMQALAELDETGETAKVTHGATREEVIVDSEAPQVKTEDGSVENKPYGLDKYVQEFIDDGKIYLSPSEVASAQRKLVDRVQKVNGITNRTNMAQFKAASMSEDGKVAFQNVYGPADSSYRSPQEGIDNVLFALRDYGVGESDLTILRRVGDEYMPTTVKEIEAKKAIRDELVKKKKKLPEEFKKSNMLDDYLVQVNFEHDINPFDVDFDKLAVKRNIFDRIPFFNSAKKGKASLQRSLVDIHSMLDPRLTLGANVAVDKASAIETALIKAADPFIQPFNKLDSERQVALMEVIKTQNFTGKVVPKRDLRAQGFSPEELDILDNWKASWDQLYHLENMDLVKSLRAGGYKRFIDEVNDTQLIARSVGKGSANKVAKVYDSELGEVRRLSQQEIDDLYDGGGTLAQLRSAETIDGVEVEHVLVRNKENGSMLRELQDSDRVLNYREGYYTVRYKDPHIIVKNTLDENGNIIASKAVKTAGTKKDAELAVANMSRGNTDTSVSYSYRDNKDRTVGQMEEDAWQIHSSTGRTSQRLRGERLGSTEPNLQDGALGAVEGPADALLNSIRSISRRTSMRDYIENYKLRFMREYEDLLKTDTSSGRLMFPSDANDFKVNEASSNKRLADARTNLEYINYLESGYRNSLDDTWKALLNGMADIVGGKSSKLEKAARAVVEEVPSPTAFFKGRAFEAYLALNPLRQLVVQAHQSTLLAVNFPKYVLSQGLARDTMSVHLAMLLGDNLKKVKGVEKLLGRSADDALALAEEYRKTGFDASIDRNNLVENGLDHLVETERLAKTKKLYKSVVRANRVVGFDAGERINIMSSWLAHRHKALEEGKDLSSKRVKEEILARARNYTFNMNAAGDMPYNKNSLALLFQFMQVPHKAMLQVLNRALTREERAKLALYNAIVLPAPVGIGYSIISGLEIEDEDTRDFIANGLEGLIFNKMAQLMFDDDTRVDFSSLAAIDPNAPIDLIHGLLNSDLNEIMSNSPALSLWTGYNPRVTNIIKETYKYVTAPEDIDAKSTLELMKTFASFSSGYMNLSKSFRELYVQEYDRRYNSSGMITDGSITTPEKLAVMMGFGSLTEAYQRKGKEVLYKDSQDAKNDVKELYLAQKQAAMRQGINIDNPEWQQHMLRAFWTATSFTSGQQKEYLSLINRDMQQGDAGIIGLINNNLNYTPAEDIKKAAIGAGVQDQVGDMIDYILSVEQMGDADEQR